MVLITRALTLPLLTPPRLWNLWRSSTWLFRDRSVQRDFNLWKLLDKFHIHQCMLGAPSKKPTTLLAINLPQLGQAILDAPNQAVCNRRHKHVALQGLDQEGNFLTAPAKQYPARMCRMLAEAIITFARLFRPLFLHSKRFACVFQVCVAVFQASLVYSRHFGCVFLVFVCVFHAWSVYSRRFACVFQIVCLYYFLIAFGP